MQAHSTFMYSIFSYEFKHYFSLTRSFIKQKGPTTTFHHHVFSWNHHATLFLHQNLTFLILPGRPIFQDTNLHPSPPFSFLYNNHIHTHTTEPHLSDSTHRYALCEHDAKELLHEKMPRVSGSQRNKVSLGLLTFLLLFFVSFSSTRPWPLTLHSLSFLEPIKSAKNIGLTSV